MSCLPVICSFLNILRSPLVYSQDGTSEQFIGEWMETRGTRDQMVIATKARHTSISRHSVTVLNM